MIAAAPPAPGLHGFDGTSAPVALSPFLQDNQEISITGFAICMKLHSFVINAILTIQPTEPGGGGHYYSQP